MDYDQYADTYAHTRSAVPWVIDPLLQELGDLSPGSTVVEIGCGTGNYVIALSEAAPQIDCKGFDVSERMLRVARRRSQDVEFLQGDAYEQFPLASDSCELAFAVDVIHHIKAIDVFFREAARIVKPNGRMIIVTDSGEDIRRRSLSKFFPEVLEIELARYPSLTELTARAADVGLKLADKQAADGSIDLDDGFIANLDAKCSSALRLISDEAHRAGIDRIRQASSWGEKWLSCYTVLKYLNERHS
jgi:SAM-dependent methyltransferase